MGKTGKPLHCRIINHRYDISHQRPEESPVDEHFNSEAHSQADVVVMMIDQIRDHDPCLHNIWESRWIRTLGTSCPSGMNPRVDSLWSLLVHHLWTSVDFCADHNYGYHNIIPPVTVIITTILYIFACMFDKCSLHAIPAWERLQESWNVMTDCVLLFIKPTLNYWNSQIKWYRETPHGHGHKSSLAAIYSFV